ncbi:MAG: hypothetical protein K8R59_02720 [Thermoanaerobaculales bacterium]|nr:hypothetical protein [Thermoanaerobaculales bacterium]
MATFKQPRDVVSAGQMWIPSASRITDHFVSTRPFQVLQKARLYPMSEGRQISQLDVAARFDFVTFNCRQAVGVVEG